MIKSKVCNDELSLLGFGMMRLPTLENGSIDEERVREMIAYAIENGVNYFDTAYPYHNGESEIVTGKILSEYPRESYRIASKYPGHQILDSYNPAEIFEEQLEKCGVDYFDYYLLHNVNDNSIKTYMDPKWGIVEYFLEQKRLGKIRHLGFSSHCSVGPLLEFLDYCGKDMEFCQIQLNYLDWTLQSAKEKYEHLTARGIPVWVMEPVRGGKLANLPKVLSDSLKMLRPDESVASWSFRFLQGLPNVKMVLSGMSNMEQMEDNIKTFSDSKPLDKTEQYIVLGIAEQLKSSVPCTECGYCLEGCPMSLNIPMLISVYNEIRFAPTTIAAMRLEELPEDKKPSACISCNACVGICPQNLKIPEHLADLAERLKTIPTWADVCKERAEAAKKRARTNQTDICEYLKNKIKGKTKLFELVDAFEKMCEIELNNIDKDDDLVLFETGNFSFGGEPKFCFSLTRQYPNGEEEYFQLHLNVKYKLTKENASFSEQEWSDCVENIFDYIRKSKSYNVLMNEEIEEIECYLDET